MPSVAIKLYLITVAKCTLALLVMLSLDEFIFLFFHILLSIYLYKRKENSLFLVAGRWLNYGSSGVDLGWGGLTAHDLPWLRATIIASSMLNHSRDHCGRWSRRSPVTMKGTCLVVMLLGGCAPVPAMLCRERCHRGPIRDESSFHRRRRLLGGLRHLTSTKGFHSIMNISWYSSVISWK